MKNLYIVMSSSCDYPELVGVFEDADAADKAVKRDMESAWEQYKNYDTIEPETFCEADRSITYRWKATGERSVVRWRVGAVTGEES
jgi:hypothetical protein